MKAKSDLTRAAVYAHFKSKMDLVAEAITDVAEEMAASMLVKLIGAVAVSRAVGHTSGRTQIDRLSSLNRQGSGRKTRPSAPLRHRAEWDW